jgi:3-deoxy-D-manno-octulosonic-acid transferase
MRILYSILLAVAFIALLPVFAYQAVFKRKYLGNLRERLGLLPAALIADARPAIWLHAVSVGEALSAAPLVKALRTRFPQHRIVVSTTTMTGQSVARSQLAGVDAVCYFPFDWKFSVRRALDAIRPQVVILMESELWLNFLDECERRKIPVIVANGRISDRSFARSRRFGFFIRELYARVTRFAMQSEIDAERALRLGAPPERVIAGGNIKFDIGEGGGSPRIAERIAETARLLDESFALGSSPLIVAGSTHEGEERTIINAFRELKARKEARLLIAPRHPDRFEVVARLLKEAGMNFARRSTAGSRAADVILLDSIGELAAVYQFASVVFVGGSLVPVGGHNILEPALYARPIVVGPHTHNFRDITREFLRREALIQLPEPSVRALRDMWIELLGNSANAESMGARARKAVEENRGATARIVSMVAELI